MSFCIVAEGKNVWIRSGGTSMSVPFAEALLERIEKGEPDLGWKADELRIAIANGKANEKAAV